MLRTSKALGLIVVFFTLSLGSFANDSEFPCGRIRINDNIVLTGYSVEVNGQDSYQSEIRDSEATITVLFRKKVKDFEGELKSLYTVYKVTQDGQSKKILVEGADLGSGDREESDRQYLIDLDREIIGCYCGE